MADVDVAHRVNGERLMLLGWPAAILMQLAHPLIAAGVHDHSGFRDSAAAAIGRLRGTTRAMLAIVFGTDGERRDAVERIRAIHRRVNGRLQEPVGRFPAGTPYSAEDPALLLWVHTSLLEWNVRTYERFVADLTPADRDAYCAASAGLAIDLGAIDADVPRTWTALTAANEATLTSDVLAVGSTGRDLARALLRGPAMRLAPPAAQVSRLVTVGLLPSTIRRAYGFDWSPRRQRRFDRISRLIRAARQATPDAIARFAAARRPRIGPG